MGSKQGVRSLGSLSPTLGRKGKNKKNKISNVQVYNWLKTISITAAESLHYKFRITVADSLQLSCRIRPITHYIGKWFCRTGNQVLGSRKPFKSVSITAKDRFATLLFSTQLQRTGRNPKLIRETSEKTSLPHSAYLSLILCFPGTLYFENE